MTLVGGCVGVLSGGLGIGGGILMVPAFIEFASLDPHTAKGTSLFVILPVAALNAWRLNHDRKDIQWRLAGQLAIGALVGGYAGGWVTRYLDGSTVLWLFIGLLGLVGFRTLFLEDPRGTVSQVRNRPALAVLIGFLSAIAGSATGTGGGIVMVPLALLAALTSNDRVVGLSNIIMVVTSAAGTAAHLGAERISAMPGTAGQVNLALAFFVFLGAQVSSRWGVQLNAFLTLRRRRIIMGALLIIVASRLAYRALSI